VLHVLDWGRWRMFVHLSVRRIGMHGLRCKAVTMSLAVWVTRRVDGWLMLGIRWCLVVIVGLVMPVGLAKRRGRSTGMTVVTFTWWRELVEIRLYHRIVSIDLRTGLMLLRLAHDGLSWHVSSRLIGVVTIVHGRWTRSAHLIMRWIGEIRMITILRSGSLRWVLRLVVGMKIGIWIGIRWHAIIGDRSVWVRSLLWYRAIRTWKRVIRHGG
jgi:hypothetical protein